MRGGGKSGIISFELIRRNKAFKRRGKIIHRSSLPELSSFTDMGFISGNQNIDIIDRGCIDPSRVLEPEIKKN